MTRGAPKTVAEIRRELRRAASPRYEAVLRRFFKTGPGEYGEGDVFLGVRVPDIRALVRVAGGLPLATSLALLRSRVHEERLFALLALVRAYQRGGEARRAAVYRLYLANTRHVNNWDLVDVSAPYILGPWLETRSRAPLRRLARSRSLWERRIAILATHHFVRRGESADALAIAAMLLDDEHDLIHKAVGWTLREVGKHGGRPALEAFLDRHAARMPRTALRYALERLPAAQRRAYIARGSPHTRAPG